MNMKLCVLPWHHCRDVCRQCRDTPADRLACIALQCRILQDAAAVQGCCKEQHSPNHQHGVGSRNHIWPCFWCSRQIPPGWSADSLSILKLRALCYSPTSTFLMTNSSSSRTSDNSNVYITPWLLTSTEDLSWKFLQYPRSTAGWYYNFTAGRQIFWSNCLQADIWVLVPAGRYFIWTACRQAFW